MKLSDCQFKKIALAVSATLLLAGCASTQVKPMTMKAAAPVAIQAMPGYFPMEIQNNIGSGSGSSPVTNVYLMLSAKQGAAPNAQCLLGLTRDTSIISYNAWVASCSPLTMSTQASQYSYSMNTLTPVAGAPVVIYIPPVISGRAFVSLNNPLDIPMTRAADGSVSIQAPSLSNPTDGNYNMIYDKFEYTYTPNSTGQETFWIDTTSVDDFSLPIALSYTDPVSHVTQYNGYTNQDRKTVMDGIKSYIESSSVDPSWQTLEVYDDVSSTGTLMRIDAPNTSPNFNVNYLTPTSSSFNYLNSLINYYSGDASHTISVNCAEVFPAGTPPGTYTFTGTMSGSNWVFVNNPPAPTQATTITINMAQATSNEFFGPGQAPLDTPDGTVRSVIVKNLTSLFSVGLLPAPDGTLLQKSYFASQLAAGKYYQPNAIFSGAGYNAYTNGNKGPWFDLYAEAIHKTSADPVYAFAFDDVLQQDGTISVINANNDQSTPVIVTLDSVGKLKVPAPGPNYNPNPPANDIMPITNVQNPGGISCTSTSCTVQATWTNPPIQDPAVQYFVMPTPSPVPAATVLSNQTFQPATATSSTITFPLGSASAPSSLPAVTVYACVPDPSSVVAVGDTCPSEANQYQIAPGVQGVSSPTQGVTPLAVSNVQNTSFSCTSTSCTVGASWTPPATQNSQVEYFVLPSPSPVEAKHVLKNQTLQPYNATSSTFTFPLGSSPAPSSISSVIVYSCLPNSQDTKAVGYDCPASINNYGLASGVPAAQSPAKGPQPLAVTAVQNPGFSCNGSTCTMSPSWTIPNGEPSSAVFYVVPMGESNATIADIINGQSFATGSSTTLTLPQSEVTMSTINSLSIIVYTCINGPTGVCPTSANNYDQSQSPGSAETPVN